MRGSSLLFTIQTATPRCKPSWKKPPSIPSCRRQHTYLQYIPMTASSAAQMMKITQSHQLHLWPGRRSSQSSRRSMKLSSTLCDLHNAAVYYMVTFKHFVWRTTRSWFQSRAWRFAGTRLCLRLIRPSSLNQRWCTLSLASMHSMVQPQRQRQDRQPGSWGSGGSCQKQIGRHLGICKGSSLYVIWLTWWFKSLLHLTNPCAGFSRHYTRLLPIKHSNYISHSTPL